MATDTTAQARRAASTTQARRAAPTQDSKSSSPAEVARRLVVELSRKGATDLAWLVEEEQANKTTVVNRAVQVYKMIMQAQAEGRHLAIADADGENAQTLWIV